MDEPVTRKSRISIETHDIGTFYDATIQYCHSERSEESHRKTLRFAQGDNSSVPISYGLI